MKKSFTIALVGAALAVTLSLVAAGSFQRELEARAAQPAARKTIERDYAADFVYASTYTGVAHIIHVPQQGERDQANVNNDDDDTPELSGRDNQPPIQRLPRRTEPRWPSNTDASPPPSVTRRAVLSAPPPLADGPTPVRPLPRIGSSINQPDKFDPPDRAAPPPAEDTPPAAPPPGG